ncbi:MAG: dTDP-4-dehydrorhamnose 3,5-epimerase [Verrucomicrobiae bacterium]|nr:dTDP-4-dehydrorhamnose 3,5-epimerase [Verrucomicrobiae bacterium]
MKLTPLALPGLLQLEVTVRADPRGYFIENFNAARFREMGLPTEFAQDNQSRSVPGVLRGLHYQFDPPQAKLVGVTRGRIFDAVVDLRPESPTYGRHYCVELSDANGRWLWIPPGLAHGFCVVGNEAADVVYKVTTPWNVAGEAGIRADDPELAIPWPVRQPVLSARDAALPSFAEYRQRPRRWELD